MYSSQKIKFLRFLKFAEERNKIKSNSVDMMEIELLKIQNIVSGCSPHVSNLSFKNFSLFYKNYTNVIYTAITKTFTR